ncbi:VCBS repeat-containing protein [Cohnella sp. WQ 127256]|uniref:VCBS repeat-containing protein n=1 Tax=Cohnella sp. WQ 127256 TaxID=2938790 RepID=UPI002118C219|nr:VCBS repeat-containing protein [Cohnella sp. WQ 127256]
MEKSKSQWEIELQTPPLLSESSNIEWMALVEKRLGKRRSIYKRYTMWAGSLAVIVMALIIIIVNEEHLRSLIPTWVTSQNTSQTHVVEGITIEQEAEIKISKKAALLGSAGEATIALINLPLIPEQDYTGYLGIWDANGKLLQKFVVEGYNIMNPVQIHVEDITGDGHPDIVLETDEHANGGLGVHVLHLYVKDNDQYVEAPLPDEVNSNYIVAFRSASNDFRMTSVQDKRQWTIQLTTDHLKQLAPNLLTQTSPVNVDPISSIAIQNNILTTKRLIWFGNLQLNSLAILETSYRFEENKWTIQSYSLENIDKSSIVTEVK